MLNLEEIKARELAATPGEWKVVCQGNAVQSLQVVTETYWERPVQISVCSSISPKREADADFIAAARADIPALIEQHEQDEQQIATLKKALESMHAVLAILGKNSEYYSVESFIAMAKLDIQRESNQSEVGKRLKEEFGIDLSNQKQAQEGQK